MTVKEMVIAALKAGGYDGLCADECGCRLDDLMPCDSPCDKCEPGYLGPAPDESEDDDFGIYPTRAEADAAREAKGDE